MKQEDWGKIRHFIPGEIPYWEKADVNALYLLDRMRHIEGLRFANNLIFIVNCIYDPEAGHTPTSYHYREPACAIDFSMRYRDTKRPLPILHQYLIALNWPWTGIGFYPYWECPGLHCEYVSVLPWYKRRKRWWRDGLLKYRAPEEYFEREGIHLLQRIYPS